MENMRGKRVFVGLSGGVDSAVSAALLQKAGADVVGVFIKGWYPPGMPCTWAEDRRDAMRVAAHLRIPFHTLDASEEYKKGVIDYLLAEYAAGRTPNPDVMCNREVKFGAFYEFAKSHGADFIATGHYSRTDFTENSHGSLLRGLDPAKDQSYFLWAVPQEALDHTLFPVGEFPKTEVRKLAEKFALPVAEKKDSQGICFLGSISVDEFLRQEFGTHPGEVFDTEGKYLGTHDGAVLHTLGERIPLHISDAQKDPKVFPGPWYVVAKDMQRNTLTVSSQHLQSTEIKEIHLRESNWFAVATLSESVHVEAQYRYHGPRIRGNIDTARNIFTPLERFPEPIALGQSLVLYAEDTCIGGGIIA